MRARRRAANPFDRMLSTVKPPQTASSPRRPLFLADSPVNIDSSLNLSTTVTSLQRPLSFVPKVAVVERFNCNYFSLVVL